MNHVTDPQVVARIKKLLNLSRDGAASENEQQLAQAHAQRLMMEHNVSVAVVEASQGGGRAARRKREEMGGFAAYAWQRELMAHVATSNFVVMSANRTAYGNKGRTVDRGFVLVGREENVVGCQVMQEYLCRTVERLARDYTGARPKSAGNAAISFEKGCAERIGLRVLEQHRAALAEKRTATTAGGGRALAVLMEDYAEAERCANEDFRLGLEPGTTAHNKFVYARKSDAWRAVAAALKDPAYEGEADRTTLRQKADEVAAAAIAACGLTAEETEAVLHYGRYAADSHADEVRERDNPTKEPRRQRAAFRRYRPRRSDSTDYAAYNAGSEAGRNVSLDRQAGHNPLKQVE